LKRRPLYDPGVPFRLHATFDEYKQRAGPTINHFYEKLLLLKDRMNTLTARRLAESRHRFMLEFLGQFYQEWEAKDPEF
jgi:uncharacterized protein